MNVNGAILTTDTTIGVANIVATDNIPYRENFEIQVDNEVMLVTSNKGNQFVVTRGYRRTVISAHADLTTIYNITGKRIQYPDVINDSKGNRITFDNTLIIDNVGKIGLNSNIVTDVDASTITIDVNKGLKHQITLAGNRTLVFASMIIGNELELIVNQDGTGTRLITWPSGIRWAGGSAPTLTTTASKTDRFKFLKIDATHYLGAIVGQNY